jgi:hypothetical protein
MNTTLFRNARIADADRMLNGNAIPTTQEPWGFKSDFVRELLADVPYSEASLRAIEWKVANPFAADIDVRILDLNDRANARGYADLMTIAA